MAKKRRQQNRNRSATATATANSRSTNLGKSNSTHDNDNQTSDVSCKKSNSTKDNDNHTSDDSCKKLNSTNDNDNQTSDDSCKKSNSTNDNDNQTSDVSCKQSTCNSKSNVAEYMEGLDIHTYTEEQLKELSRKKLYDIYREALSRLICMGYSENVAIKGLTNGYWGGNSDSLTNIVESSSKFLSAKIAGSRSLGNLENIVDFNLQFMAILLERNMPGLTIISIYLCILMGDLNFVRDIVDIDDAVIQMTEMLSGLNLDVDDDNGDKDMFLPVETREMLSNWNILDKNVKSISEDMKDEMIVNLNKMVDDLETQVYERIRWATKTMTKAITKLKDESVKLVKLRKLKVEADEIMEINYLFKKFLVDLFNNKASELASMRIQFSDAEKASKDLETEQGKTKAEISASKLIDSETRKKCLEVLKREKNGEKQRLKRQEEIAIEKKKIWEAEQQLDETEAAIMEAKSRLVEVTKEKDAAMIRLAVEMSLKEYISNCAADYGWKCIICKEYKAVRIVFLPCAHQVMCVHCDGEYVNKGNTRCPCCNHLIEGRINPLLP